MEGIRLAWRVHLDVSTALEAILEPVVVRGVRVHLVPHKVWKNLFLECKLLKKLTFWKTLGSRGKELGSPAFGEVSGEANTESDEKSNELYANGLPVTEVWKLESAELMMSGDPEVTLEGFQCKFYFRKRIEGFIKLSHNTPMKNKKWNYEKHSLEGDSFANTRCHESLKWSQAIERRYIVRVMFGRVRLDGVVAHWMLIEVLVAPISDCKMRFDIWCDPQALPRELKNVSRGPASSSRYPERDYVIVSGAQVDLRFFPRQNRLLRAN